MEARLVLDAHADLQRRLAQPNDSMAGYTRAFMADAVEKSGWRAGGMFYPINLDGGVTGAHGAALCRFLGGDLRDAETYQVTSDMMHVLRQVSLDVAQAVEQLLRAELPCEAAFCWLDEPWGIRDANGIDIPVRAVSWKVISAALRGPIMGAREPAGGWPAERWHPVAAVRIAQWTAWEDDRAWGRIPPDREEDAAQGARELGNLTMLHVMTVPFGVRFDGFGRERAERPDSALHMMHVLWSFLTAEITTSHRPQIDRATRRRALRSLKHGEVNVVILRRSVHDPDEPGWVHKVDWSCRWIVQGHYRHLERYEGPHHKAVANRPGKNCLVCDGKLSWVRPYMKGPDGMPLHYSGGELKRLAR